MSDANGGKVVEESYLCPGCNEIKPDSAYSYAINKRAGNGGKAYRFKKCRICRNTQAIARYHTLADDARRMAILDALPALGRVGDTALRDEIMEGVQNLLRNKSKHQTSTVSMVKAMRGRPKKAQV